MNAPSEEIAQVEAPAATWTHSAAFACDVKVAKISLLFIIQVYMVGFGTSAYNLQCITIAVLLWLLGWIPGIVYAIYRTRIYCMFISGQQYWNYTGIFPPASG